MIFLGEGKNGKVHLLPNGKVIKFFKHYKNCLDEYTILEKVNGNKYFPRVYECTKTYMIRDYVGGSVLPTYIKKHGLSKRLALNLIGLIEDFERIGFTRLDIRCEHIFVQNDKSESIIIIDPRAHYTKQVSYPRQMTGGLKKLGVLRKFIHVLQHEKPYLYNKWKNYIDH